MDLRKIKRRHSSGSEGLIAELGMLAAAARRPPLDLPAQCKRIKACAAPAGAPGPVIAQLALKRRRHSCPAIVCPCACTLSMHIVIGRTRSNPRDCDSDAQSQHGPIPVAACASCMTLDLWDADPATRPGAHRRGALCTPPAAPGAPAERWLTFEAAHPLAGVAALASLHPGQAYLASMRGADAAARSIDRNGNFVLPRHGAASSTENNRPLAPAEQGAAAE